MQVQTYSETRANLKACIESVIERHEPLLITSKSDDVILISKEDYDSLIETSHLLSLKANRKHLETSINSFEWRNAKQSPRVNTNTLIDEVFKVILK